MFSFMHTVIDLLGMQFRKTFNMVSLNVVTCASIFLSLKSRGAFLILDVSAFL